MALTKEEKWVMVGYGAIAVAYAILFFTKYAKAKKD